MSDIPFELVPTYQPAQDSAPSERQPAPADIREHVHAPASKAGHAANPEDLAASASSYCVDPPLSTAINLALSVGAPLLITGEPGTGKTQVAYFLQWYLGLELFRYQARSTSTADDLRYDFDAVAYLRYANDGEAKKDRSDPEFLKKRALWQAYESKTRSLLLIDEIDKAPRDFPNDLLQEFAEFGFEHPFTGEPIRPQGPRPIVVATSNAERRLPDAFLRRCIVHHIELTPELVNAIVQARLDSFPRLEGEFLEQAIRRFFELRSVRNLTRKPATGELLTWLAVLSAQGIAPQQLNSRLADLPALGALVKDAADRETLRGA